jgi:hypothetical protein
VLVLSDPCDAADLLAEAGVAFQAPPDDVEAIARCLQEAFGRWRKGESGVSGAEPVLSRFDRRHLTGRLAEVLASVSAASTPVT